MTKSNIYTRTGDSGMTSLVGGQRVAKCSERLDAYGTVDELNAHVGLLICHCPDIEAVQPVRTMLTRIQNTLFVVGSHLATDTSQTQLRAGSVVSDDDIQAVETEIDRLDALLPRLRAFVLPAGTLAASQAHVCRTVCRRAERCILRMAASTGVDERVTAYVNRLSDYFFVLARYMNVVCGNEETVWVPAQ